MRPDQTSQDPMYSWSEKFWWERVTHSLWDWRALLFWPAFTPQEVYSGSHTHTLYPRAQSHTLRHIAIHFTFSQTHTQFTSNTCSLTNAPLRCRLPFPCVTTPGDAQSCYLSMYLTHPIFSLLPLLFQHSSETGALVWWHSVGPTAPKHRGSYQWSRPI